MKPLWLSGVTGLFQELYQPDTESMLSTSLDINNDILDSGQLFWNWILQRERIEDVVHSLEMNIHNPANQLPQFWGIVGDKDKFINNALDCRVAVCDQGIGQRYFFSKLETLSILCELYSRFEFSPFRLTVQDGFVLNEVSANEIICNSLSTRSNPYLPFINNVIIPLVIKYSPDIIFCTGRVSYFNIAVAMIVKMYKKSVHICLTRHSSEYYSLNKIEKYLINNEKLFSVVDSVILEYFDKYEQALLKALEKNEDISKLPNMLTSTMVGKINCIRHCSPKSDTKSVIVKRKKQIDKLRLSPEKIFDVHFEPYVKCFWNKCAFCGINKKYSYKDRVDKADGIRQRVVSLCSDIPNGSFLWFIDEAITPFKLNTIAEYFICNNLNYIWQARCRIDKKLLMHGLVEKLACAGLKELRLGLESASLRILKLMNKFEDKLNLEFVEEIVRVYTEHGISIHFPMIIGFPGEEVADRQMTYEFLSYMREKYSSFTFNLNIFNFDVASPLFKLWDRYQISKISFPCASSDFVGNVIHWDGPTKIDDRVLENERNSFMRSKLYYWMPKKSFITPIIFYRLSETIRNTLIWKASDITLQKHDISTEHCLNCTQQIVVTQKTNGEYIAYNWDTHHYIEGDETLIKILNTWKVPKSIGQGIDELSKSENKLLRKDDIAIIVKKMLAHGHLLNVDKNTDVD